MIEDINNTSLEKLFHEISKMRHHQAMERLEKLGLYRGQPPILFILYKEDGKTQKDITELMQIKPSTLSKMIQRMEKSGFLTREHDQNDKRVMRVYLTTKARKIRVRVKKAIEDIETKTFANISAEERIILKRIFMQMYNNLND